MSCHLVLNLYTGMEKQAFDRIIDRYLQGKASGGERLLVEECYKRLDEQGETNLTPEQESALREMMLQNIRKRMQRSAFKITRWLSAAAAVFVLLAAGVYFFLNRQKKPQQAVDTFYQSDAAPGGDKALLTLSDGKQMILEEAEHGTLALQGGARVDKTPDGQLIYTRVVRDADRHTPEVLQHTLSTPRGGQYKLGLPDGTRVWLNAASSITYPTSFSGQERSVSITGEVYFEVAENPDMPFKVHLPNHAEIEVLGTHFNVMAYEDEEAIQTTLLKGSVRVSKKPRGFGAESSKLLKPGQQARVNKGEAAIRILEADPDEALAWKNELFLFSGTDIETIMRRIARWYDVEVVYEGDLNGRTFTGQISRYSSVSKVLQMLEFTGGAHFKIQGRRITVMP